MSFRITQGMLYQNSLTNFQNAASRSLRLQNQIATGRRILRPSDDPGDSMKIMPLRTELRSLRTSMDILATAGDSLNVATSVLEDVSGVVQRLRELTVKAASSTVSEEDRRIMASEIDQLLNQALSAANTRHGQGHLFAGARSTQPPFQVTQGPAGKRVAYVGGANPSALQIPVGVPIELPLAGDTTFLFRDRQPTQFTGTTGAAASGSADSGIGFGTLQVNYDGLTIPAATTGLAEGDNSTTALGDLTYAYAAGSPPTLSINGGAPQPVLGGTQSFFVGANAETVSLDVTTPIVPPSGTITSRATLSTDGGATTLLVDDFTVSPEYQVVNSLDGTVLNVDVSALSAVGEESVKFAGTFDIFTTLIAVADLMRNEEGLPAATVVQELSQMLDEVDFGHDSVLSSLQDLGNRGQSLDLLEDRLGAFELAQQESLSLIEDADLAKSILELNQQELSFQASLQISARAVQTSLMSFLG